MAFARVKKSKELEIISLIDVVFLLIIFGMVISTFPNIGRESERESFLKIEVQREPQEHADDESQNLMVTIKSNGLCGGEVTRKFPSDDLLTALQQDDFENQPACALISSRIACYADIVSGTDTLPKHIDVKVSRDTKLRIISFILRECAPYRSKDTLLWVKIASD